MKHSVVLKFVAILLAACALTVTIGSALGVFLLAEQGLYTKSYQEWQENHYQNLAHGLGSAMAESYAARSLSNFNQEELRYISWGNTPETIGSWWAVEDSNWCYRIENGNGLVLESSYTAAFADAKSFTMQMSVSYPTKVANYAPWDNNVVYYTDDSSEQKILYIQYVQSPEYKVTVWLTPESISQVAGNRIEVYEMLQYFRYHFIAGLAGGILLAAVFLVYLCCAAGKRRSEDTPEPGGLNRLPLDIYAAITTAVCLIVAGLTVEIVEAFLFYGSGINVGWLAIGILLVLVASVFLTGFLFALASQCKMGGFYPWKHSLIGFVFGKLWKGLCCVGRWLRKLFGLLPLMWRYLLIGLAMGVVPLWFFYLAAVGESYWVGFLFLSCLCDLIIIGYGAYAYGTVLQGARKMAAGELYIKVDTRYLLGKYKTCAESLNALADVIAVAAKNQMKSERMKTELITNVSHDIKTPLTSIINYVDLLQKAETPEQTQQYLQVLDRQSQRMKKLVDDLMEMSKASSGNLSVEITCVDVAEAVNQALGEFADKLTAKDLNVVFSPPDNGVAVLADGRLMWRVLSNLLSNIVKYALPGTRVYVDLVQQNGVVQISLKNISKESLNVSAEELTERFVRGDASRNTDGSGLGLNIAKSLMELQKGRLELLVDGDLFKVTLTFPAG